MDCSFFSCVNLVLTWSMDCCTAFQRDNSRNFKVFRTCAGARIVTLFKKSQYYFNLDIVASITYKILLIVYKSLNALESVWFLLTLYIPSRELRSKSKFLLTQYMANPCMGGSIICGGCSMTLEEFAFQCSSLRVTWNFKKLCCIVFYTLVQS